MLNSSSPRSSRLSPAKLKRSKGRPNAKEVWKSQRRGYRLLRYRANPVGEKTMDVLATVVSSGIGLVSGLVSAYAAMRFKMREERGRMKAELLEQAKQRYLEGIKEGLQQQRKPGDRTPAWVVAEQHARHMLIVDIHETNGKAVDRQKVFVMPGTRLMVGRAPDNDIVLQVAGISGRHCFFEDHRGSLFVNDLRGANGVHVNGERVERSMCLRAGDVVELEGVQITVAELDVR